MSVLPDNPLKCPWVDWVIPDKVVLFYFTPRFKKEGGFISKEALLIEWNFKRGPGASGEAVENRIPFLSSTPGKTFKSTNRIPLLLTTG